MLNKSTDGLVIPESLKPRLTQLNDDLDGLVNKIQELRSEHDALVAIRKEKQTERDSIMEVIEAFQPLVAAADPANVPTVTGDSPLTLRVPAEEDEPRRRAARRPVRQMVIDAISAAPEGLTIADIVKSCETTTNVVKAAIDHFVETGEIVFDGTTARVTPVAGAVEATEEAVKPEPEPVPPAAVQGFTFYDLDGATHVHPTLQRAVEALSGILDLGLVNERHGELMVSRENNLPFLDMVMKASPEIGTELAVKYARAIEKTKPQPVVAPPPPPPPPPEPIVEPQGLEVLPEAERVMSDDELLVDLLARHPGGMRMVEIGQHGLNAAVVYNAERAGIVLNTGGIYTVPPAAAAAQ